MKENLQISGNIFAIVVGNYNYSFKMKKLPSIK